MKNNPVFIRQKRLLKKIYPAEIHCLTTVGNYTHIFFTPKEYFMVRCTLDNALKILPPDEFVKTHRSHAVSINFIDEIGWDYVRISDVDIPLSRQYRKALMEKLPVIE